MLSITHGLEKGMKLAIFVYLKDDLGIKADWIVILFTITNAAYGIKPILGYLIDLISTKVSKVKYTVYVSIGAR